MNPTCLSVNNDNFIQLLNQSMAPEMDCTQEKWMFGYEEQNPFLPRIDEQPVVKKVFKEKDIICQNKELFNVNQSKSIYLSKITHLIDTEIPPKHKTTEKWKRKLNQLIDSSEEQFQGDTHQQKLARNRQSARDSRKRKKIYIELLENKVEDLSQEVLRLEEVVSNQNTYITYCAKMPSLIKDFHIGYQNSLAQLKVQPSKESATRLDQEYGVQSQRRAELCSQLFNTLMDFTLPTDMKKVIESSFKGLDIFDSKRLLESNNKYLQDFKLSLNEETSRLEFYMFDMAKLYEKIRHQTFVIDVLKQDLIVNLGVSQYTAFLLGQTCSNTEIKEEEVR